VGLPTTIPPTSQYRLLYSGQIGVSGVNVQQSWDITDLPKYLRNIKSFKNNWRVFVRQVDVGISDVSKAIDFLPLVGTPEEIVLTLTAATPFDLIDIEFWYIHSLVR
jgi:hypothetical protein